MSPDTFYSLPPAIALRILVEGSAKLREIVEASEAPKVPRPPRFDQRISKKGGFMWASECTLDDLTWWFNHKTERAAAGGAYAEKDAKLAKSLDYWVQWRRVEPIAPWSGERNHEAVTACAPSGKATVYEWEPRGPVTSPLPIEDGYGAKDDTDDIPF